MKRPVMAEAPQPVPPAKHALRETMRERLAAMTPEERREASSLACGRLINLDEFRHASVVMLYMPLASEVDTTAIAIRCFQAGKTICVPRVDWERRDMVAVEVNSFDDHYMETDDHGLRTPKGGRRIVPSSIDLVVVPALAFDTHGNRLGRGGGYYDRFLSQLRRAAKTVGLGYDVQIVDQVPADERDVQVGIVVTDRRVSHSRPSRV
jgi:5-formyltetrahydrofolate cyclo-ligase